MQYSLSKHTESVTVLANVVRLVRHDDHGPVLTLFKQFKLTLLVKARIAYGNDFVNQEAVELNRHGNGKGETGTHAGRISLDWLPYVFPKLGEIPQESL